MARSLRIVLLSLVAVVGAAIVTVALPARAAERVAEMDKKAKADAKEAMLFYKQGNYDDAAKVFVKLSIAYPDMLVFVRNLGACYYYMRRFEPALSNLRDYVHRKKDIAPDDRAEVEGWIGEMERMRDQAPTAAVPAVALPAEAPAASATAAPAASSTAAAPRVAVEPAATPAPSAPPAGYPPAGAQTQYAYPPAPQGYPSTYEPPQSYPPGYGPSVPANGTYPPVGVMAPAPAPQAQPSSGGARKTVAWILGAVGVGSVLAGVYCTVTALDRFSTVAKKYDPSVEKEGNNFAKAQWVGYGVGAALITTAIIVGASGGSSSSPSVAFAPAVGPGSAGAVMSGSF
jgi:hypothetical protein